MWRPDLSALPGPRYRAIAEALRGDIERGQLRAGDRLPTHRDLADALGVTVGTVTRAYREAEDRGLVRGEVGRGTFVAADRATPPVQPGFRIRDTADRSLIDLSLNFLRAPGQAQIIADTLSELARDPLAVELLQDYKPQAGVPSHRAIAARFIADAGMPASPDDVLVCAGAQHAITVALLGLTRPGDTLLCAEVTYPTIVTLARTLHLRLQSVPLDREGIRPDALEAACRSHQARALYCMPTLQNPSTAVMSVARREQIAAIVRRHRLAVIEDDVYGFLLDDPLPPLASLCGELGHYLTSLSKSAAPGLRIGYLVVPPGDLGRFLDVLWSTTVMASPLMAEVASRWIADGTAHALARSHRVEAAARQRLAASVLGRYDYDAHPNAFHVWLRLPDEWHSASFVTRAQQRGIALVPGESFAVGPLRHPAVRVSLGAPHSLDELRQGLEILDSVLRSSDTPRVV